MSIAILWVAVAVWIAFVLGVLAGVFMVSTLVDLHDAEQRLQEGYPPEPSTRRAPHKGQP